MIEVAADLQASVGMLSKIDWDVVKGAVQNYSPIIAVIRNTWSRETLKEISEGKVFVTDDVLNEILEKNISGESQITALKVLSRETGRLDIYAQTRNLGRIELSGTIERCSHNEEGTYFVYRVHERELLDRGIESWIFSRISLSMAQKIMGRFQFSDDVPTKIHHNTITVDLSKVLEATDLAKTEFRGYKILDMVRIEGAKPKQGGIEIDADLVVPEDIKTALFNLLN